MSRRWLRSTPALLLIALAALAALPAAAASPALQSPAPHYLKTSTKVVRKAICNPDAFTLCLQNNRFEVFATFDTSQGQSGDAHVVKLTADTGYLWFFSPDNVETVVKVIDACSFSQNFWFFAGGLTNVHVVFTVTDTLTSISNLYENPPNTPFEPIQDTSAFHTCP
jgi:hypothetical protein